MSLLTALTLVIGPASASAAPPPADAAPSADRSPTASAPTATTVTLLTGDRVTVRTQPDGMLAGDVQPGPGRSDVLFVQQSGPGSLTVVPADAHPLIASGKLDKRLFDVAYLVEHGYADGVRAGLPLIATYRPGTRAASTNAAQALSTLAEPRRSLPSIDGGAFEVPKAEAATFWGTLTGSGARGAATRTTAAAQPLDGVRKLWLDAKVTASLEVSVPYIGAPAAWQAGHTASGVTVAVLDTGYDPAHPDLAGVVTTAVDFTGTSPTAADRHGHGTHVASIIAGRGTASGGKHVGVARGAKLVVGKVLGDTGEGLFSQAMAAMEWAARETPAKVINMSFGAMDTPEVDPVEELVNRLTAETGKLFVVAAGNHGPRPFTLGTPSTADAALSVANVSTGDALAEGSSRGPRLGDRAVKPDIAAPGTAIVAARSAGVHPNGSDVIDDWYLRAGGTSMASPHVAGAAAIVAGQHPEWDAATLKAALTSTTAALPEQSPYEVGAGRVDVARAVSETFVATRSSVSFGFLRWPYTDPQPLSEEITFRNDGASPVTVDLRIDATAQDGTPAAPGTFTVSPQQLTVPAHATGSVVVTFERGAADPGTYGGVLIAESSDGAHRARVALGGTKEPESYEVTFQALDRTGQLPPEGALFDYLAVFNHDTGDVLEIDNGDTVRLPVGRYGVYSYLTTNRAGTWVPSVSIQAYPEVKIDRTTTVTLDARQAQRVSYTVDDRPDAKLRHQYQHAIFRHPATSAHSYSSWTTSLAGDLFDEVYVGGANDSDGFGFASSARLTDSAGNAYNLTFPSERRVPDVDFHVTAAGLGRVDGTYRGLGGQSQVRVGFLPVYFDRYLFNLTQNLTVPSTHTEYFSPGIPFHQTVEPLVWTPLRSMKPGERRSETFLAGVIGPSFAAAPPAIFQNYGPSRPHWAYRSGDTIDVHLPMLVDSGAGHVPAMLTGTPIGGTVKLFRDGTLVGGNSSQPAGWYRVPADPAEYRLEASLTCDVVYCQPTSPAASSVWTFRSSHTGTTAPLPLMAVRYAPVLDELNRAPAGTFSFPVYVEHQPGSVKNRTVRELTMEASFDDGATWTPVSVRRHGNDWTAQLANPGSGTVSLRAVAVDRYGNSVRQTVLRAYGVSS
ncbi:S8 family serine peptidase [Micromonospora sp. NPDC047074]|uniref:S8 family peptidase n=1 Tax=Micromonospora sp. NPDC047074 TaxID=3154339 RepID=UPI00341023C0